MAAPYPPLEPPPSPWAMGEIEPTEGNDLVAAGADLSAGTLLDAYRHGLFPMGLGEHGEPPIGWWAPDPRGVLRAGAVKIRPSLRKVLPRFEIRVDVDFAGVLARCADPEREGRWITGSVAQAYSALHELGWAHSVEAWQDGKLVGGLYGVAIGGLFAGESMFHSVRDASKAALVGLTELFFADGDPRRVIDVQWATPHLISLGVTETSRAGYHDLLAQALRAPQVDFGCGATSSARGCPDAPTRPRR